MTNKLQDSLPNAIENLKRLREVYKDQPKLLSFYEPSVLYLMSSILSYSPYDDEVVVLDAWKCNGNIYIHESELVETEDYQEYETYNGYVYNLHGKESELASLLLKDFYESKSDLLADLTKYHFHHHITDLT